MGLFGSKRPRIYYIEINDEIINKHISQVILTIEKGIMEFKKALSSSSIELREKTFESFRKELLNVRGEINTIKNDVQKIINIELSNEDYFNIKDESFIKDKEIQLARVFEQITKFLEIIEQRPSQEALKEELLAQMQQQLDTMLASTNKIVADDINLRQIYKKLKNF